MSQALARVEAPAPAEEAARRIPFGPDGRTRFTREDYLKLVEGGLLEERSRVELLEGQVVPMSPISPHHNSVAARLNAFYTPRLFDKAFCALAGSMAVGDDSQPEPDFGLFERRDDFYRNALPTGRQALLLVEVSITSLKQDLGRKAKLYARGGAAEYWVAEPEKQTLHVHRRPDAEAGRWDEIVRLKPGSKAAPAAFPDAELDLAWLFG